MKKLRLLILALVILILNLLWEFSHYRLYVDLTGIPSTIHLIIASFADLFLVFIIFLIISIFRKSIKWAENPKKSDYLAIIVLGVFIASVIEVYSLSNGRWVYTKLMPTIFGIGLSPLVQLFTTSIMGLWLQKVIEKN